MHNQRVFTKGILDFNQWVVHFYENHQHTTMISLNVQIIAKSVVSIDILPRCLYRWWKLTAWSFDVTLTCGSSLYTPRKWTLCLCSCLLSQRIAILILITHTRNDSQWHKKHTHTHRQVIEYLLEREVYVIDLWLIMHLLSFFARTYSFFFCLCFARRRIDIAHWSDM